MPPDREEVRQPSQIDGPEFQTACSPQTIPVAIQFSPSCADAYVVVVVTPAGRHLRRAFLSMSGGEKAYNRALEAGQPAAMILCHLTPVEPSLSRGGSL